MAKILNSVCNFYIKKQLIWSQVGGSISTEESEAGLLQSNLSSEFQASLACKYETWCQRTEQAENVLSDSAYLACTKPWASSSAQQISSMLVYACNSTYEMEERDQFKGISNRVNSRIPLAMRPHEETPSLKANK